MNDDYGYFGKGITGYVHYNEAVKHNSCDGRRGGPPPQQNLPRKQFAWSSPSLRSYLQYSRYLLLSAVAVVDEKRRANQVS